MNLHRDLYKTRRASLGSGCERSETKLRPRRTMKEINSMPQPRLILDLGGVIVDHDNALCYDRLIALLENRPTRAEIALLIAASGVGDGSITAEELFASLRERY